MKPVFNHVNWVDGMKINKSHFIQSDQANIHAVIQATASLTNPLRFGIIPQTNTGQDGFNVQIALDNQNAIRINVVSLEAITIGGYRISIQHHTGTNEDGSHSYLIPYSKPDSASEWWIVIVAKPFQQQPFGTINPEENPPRFPHLKPTYDVQLVTQANYDQFAFNPAALFIGKLKASPQEVYIDEEYIPPCLAPASHPDLAALCGEFDHFLSNLELRCVQIVQKILTKNQQNDLAELVQFVCDRLILHLSQAITRVRWMALYDSPALLFSEIVSLARVLKNAMDLRLGSGKEEMMNYIIEWSELKQGELDALLTHIATLKYNNNDVSAQIGPVIQFVRIINKLFDTLGKLEYIGKKKDSGYFVNEAPTAPQSTNAPITQADKPKRRFFG